MDKAFIKPYTGIQTIGGFKQSPPQINLLKNLLDDVTLTEDGFTFRNDNGIDPYEFCDDEIVNYNDFDVQEASTGVVDYKCLTSNPPPEYDCLTIEDKSSEKCTLSCEYQSGKRLLVDDEIVCCSTIIGGKPVWRCCPRSIGCCGGGGKPPSQPWY